MSFSLFGLKISITYVTNLFLIYATIPNSQLILTCNLIGKTNKLGLCFQHNFVVKDCSWLKYSIFCILGFIVFPKKQNVCTCSQKCMLICNCVYPFCDKNVGGDKKCHSYVNSRWTFYGA